MLLHIVYINFRLLWSFFVIGACILCGVLVYPIYVKWQTQPTITSVDETNFAIWNIYFPAVTICSNNKVVESQIDKLLRSQPWKNITKNDSSFEKHFREAITTTVLFDAEPEELDQLDNEAENVINTHKKKIPAVLQKVFQK